MKYIYTYEIYIFIYLYIYISFLLVCSNFNNKNTQC